MADEIGGLIGQDGRRLPQIPASQFDRDGDGVAPDLEFELAEAFARCFLGVAGGAESNTVALDYCHRSATARRDVQVWRETGVWPMDD